MAIDFNRINDDQFEEMCRLLVLAENPDAIAVEPLQGDEGIDSFQGVLDEQVGHIWQFKYFKTGIGKSQQEQIRKSLVKAIAKHKPKRWTLVTSADMSAKSLRWLREQQKKHPDTEIDVIPATKIRALLVKQQGIRKLYFTLADEKNDIILKAMGERGMLSDTKPKAALVKDMQRAAEVVNDNSPDFKVTVTSSEEGTHIIIEPRYEGAAGKTVMKMGLSFSTQDEAAAAALAEYRKHMREGRPVTLDSRYFTIEEAVFDELVSDDFTCQTVSIVPQIPFVETPLKLVARSGDEVAELPYLAMRLVRRGESEFEVANAHDADALLTFSFVFRYDGQSSTANFQLRDYDGKKPSEVIQIERFANLIVREGTSIELVNIRDGRPLGTVTACSSAPEVNDTRLRFFEDLLAIEQNLNPNMAIPPEWGTPEDVLAARALATAMTGEITLPRMLGKVATDPEQTLIFRRQMEEHGSEGLSLHFKADETVGLFGVPYASHASYVLRGAADIDENEDGSATVRIDGTLTMKYEDIRVEGTDEEGGDTG